nr:cation transporter [Rufibacter quisquiliarum]
MANAVILIGIFLYILYEAYLRFQDPPEVESKAILFVASIGLVVNLTGMYILSKGSKVSLKMKGAYFEGLSNMLTSVGVIINILATYTFKLPRVLKKANPSFLQITYTSVFSIIS